MESVLKIVIGSNLFSLSELGNLKKGDVAVSSQIAGKPVELLWNDGLVAYGEIVVIDKLLGFRMTSFEVGKETPVPFYKKEKLVDIVEAKIVFSAKKAGFDELLGIREHTLIIFGDMIDQIDAQLVMGGEKIAAGKICVVTENLGIEISEIFFPGEIDLRDYPYKSTGNIIKSERKNKNVKLYDFRRPDKFSFLQLNNIMRLHEIFIDNALFNAGAEARDLKARVKSIDQRAFYELFDEMKKSRTCLIKFDDGFYRPPVENDMELRSSENKMSEEQRNSFMKIIDKSYNLNESCDEEKYSNSVMILYKEKNPLIRKNIFELSFKKAWEMITHIDPGITDEDAGFEKTANLLPKYDMICIVEIEYDDSKGKKSFMLVYPYITIESVLPKLSKKIL